MYLNLENLAKEEEAHELKNCYIMKRNNTKWTKKISKNTSVTTTKKKTKAKTEQKQQKTKQQLK